MLAALKSGRVERKAIRAERKRTARAYDVLVGSGRIAVAGRERSDR